MLILKTKIKVSVPNLLLEILEQDLHQFSITKERLCNIILLKFSSKDAPNYNQEMMFENKTYLQFALNKDNIGYYSKLSQKKKNMSNSEIIREIFLSYAVLPPFLRETILFREKIIVLNTTQKEKVNIQLDTGEEIVEGIIEDIFRDTKTRYLKLKLEGKDYFISKVRIIS